MLSKQRRSSQRLASVLEAMTSDLEGFNEVEVSTETEEALINSDEADALADYVERDVDWKNLSKEEQLQMIGDEDDEIEEDEDEEVDFDDELDELEDVIDESGEDDEVFSFEDDEIKEFKEDDEIEAAIEDEIGNETNGNGPGGDRSVSLEKELVGGGNVEFDKEDEYEDSIRNVVTARKARVASIVAKLDNIADRLEKAGNKKLAYRVDVVSDKLEKEYLK